MSTIPNLRCHRRVRRPRQEASVSKIKNISRTGWLVAGIIAALLLMPTAAVAVTTATITIIKGGTAAGEASVTATHQLQTNAEIQGTSGNHADVTPDGQVLSTTAEPSAYVNTNEVNLTPGVGFVPVASPPSGDALIVTTIHIDTTSDPTPGPGQDVALNIQTGACSGSQVGSYGQAVNPGSPGETDVPFTPGLAIPAGDALCGAANGSVLPEASVSGYTVPSSEVPAGPFHRVRALPRQRG
jgi:hypothetical protein